MYVTWACQAKGPQAISRLLSLYAPSLFEEGMQIFASKGGSLDELLCEFRMALTCGSSEELLGQNSEMNVRVNSRVYFGVNFHGPPIFQVSDYFVCVI